jgi:hypothetical protein
VYKPRITIIPIQVEDEYRPVIRTTVCIEYHNVKEILILGV